MKKTFSIILIICTATLTHPLMAQTKKRPRLPVTIEQPALVKEMGKVKISGFAVNKMTVEDALTLVSAKYAKASGKGKKINFLFKCDAATRSKLISLDLSAVAVPTTDVIYYVCLQAGLNFRIDDFAVVLWKLKPKERLNRY